jgi:hypothetical protein
MKRFQNERENEIKNIKKSALNYAILYFKSRSDEQSKIFTNEAMKILKKYSILRVTLEDRDSQLSLASQRNISQEYII